MKRAISQHAIFYPLIAITYIFSGKVALLLALPPGYASAIFPPAGIAVAATFIAGKKTLPWVFLGALVLNIWVSYSASQQIDTIGLAAAIFIAVASVLQALIGGWALRRAIGYPAAFDKVQDIFRFSLLAPIICLTSASLSVLALWALGIFASHDLTENWFSWWIGDTLGLLVMLPITLVFAGEPRHLWQSRTSTVALPMALVFSLFIVIFLKTNQWEQEESLAGFRQMSRQAMNRIQTSLEEQTTVLAGLNGLFVQDVDVHVTRQEFHRYTQGILARFPMMQAIEWAPRVESSQRIGFEAAQRKDITGFAIKARDATGKLQQAGNDAQFYPVTYVEPLAGNQPALGFNLASDLARRTAIAKAIATTAVVATAPIHLVQTNSQAGILIMQSVSLNAHEQGIVLIVLKMNDFVDKLLPTASGGLQIRLIDDDAQSVVYDNFATQPAHILFERTFDFATRHYRLQTMPTAAYFSQHRGWQSWAVLVMGALITGLLGSLLLLGTGYTARVVTLVEERTKELQKRERQLNESQHTAMLGSWELDLTSNKLTWSDEIFNIFEIDPAHFGASYEAFMDAVHPDDRERVNKAYADHLTTRAPYEITHRLRLPNGRVKFVSERCHSDFDTDGKPLRSIGTVQDVTRNTQSAELLRKSAEEIADLYHHAPCGYHSLDKNGVITKINNTELEWMGYTEDEVVGKLKMADWMSPESAKVWHKNFPLLMKQGLLNGLELEFVRQDGTRFLGLVNTLLIRNADDHHLSSRSTVFDITERKKAEETLHTFYTVIEQSPIAVIITDANTNIQYVNPHFIKLTGYDPAEMHGRNLRILQSGQIAKKTYLEMWSTLSSGRPWHGELLNRGKQGQLYWEESSITPVLDPSGAITNYIVVSTDISERKNAEATMRHMANYDPLTDLPNRPLINDRLQRALAAASRNKTRSAVMFLDLDKFKFINDTFGHDIGDLLLKETAHRIQNCIRKSDTVGRLGGDEFIVLLPTIDSELQATAVAEKIRDALNQPFVLAEHQLNISSSIGIAIYPEHGIDGQALIKNADTAMYHAKATGRDKVMLFQPDLLENNE